MENEYRGRRTIYHPSEGGGRETDIPEDPLEMHYRHMFRELREPPRPRMED